MSERLFHIGDIISGYTGVLMTHNGIGAMYELYNFLTGESLMTHQLPRVGRELKPLIAHQLPFLRSVDVSEVNTENWQEWLALYVNKFGEYHSLVPVAQSAITKKDALEEAQEMFGDNVIVVEGNDE